MITTPIDAWKTGVALWLAMAKMQVQMQAQTMHAMGLGRMPGLCVPETQRRVMATAKPAPADAPATAPAQAALAKAAAVSRKPAAPRKPRGEVTAQATAMGVGA